MDESATARARPSILTPLMVWFLVLCVSVVVMLTEAVWVLFVLWLPWFVWTRWNARAATVVGVLCVVVLIAHSLGYMVAGSPRVVTNRPFEPDASITAFGPGATVTLSDGRSFRLAGLKEVLTADGRGALGPNWPIAGRDSWERRRAMNYDIPGALPPDDIRWAVLDERLNLWETAEGIPVQITDEGNGSAQLTVGRRHLYWCGNSFFPTLFPRNLPRFGKADLGLLLIQTGAVEPDGSATDAAYQARLDAAHQARLDAAHRARLEVAHRAHQVELERARKEALKRPKSPTRN